MFPWDMTSNEQQHACMHALASESSICGCQVFGILQPAWSGRSSKICCLSINCCFNKKSEKIFQGSYITSVSDQPFVGIGNLEVGGECTPHFFERGYCPPTDTFWIE